MCLVSRVHLTIGALRWAVQLGKRYELQGVEGELPTAHILHGVLAAATLAEPRRMTGRGQGGMHMCGYMREKVDKVIYGYVTQNAHSWKHMQCRPW